jgi:hypothetical protein
MQIHELTQRTVTEASIADRIKSAATAVKTGMQNVGDRIAASNAAAATAQQDKTQAQAARYAQTLQRQGYGTAATAPAPATAPATQTPAEPMRLGNKILDPNNPSDAQIIAKAQATQQPAAATTTPVQPTAPATATPAGPAAAPQAAQAVNTNRLQAGPVALGGAPAVMLAGDFNAALSGLKLNTNHIKELKDKIAQDASFANAFLKALGLKK